MHLNVFFTPSAIVVDRSNTNDVYIVIDVIRATTSMAVMLDQGAARILAASTVEEAKEAARNNSWKAPVRGTQCPAGTGFRLW